MAMTETQILLSLPKELKKLIDQAAQQKRISRSAVIRLAISQWLDQEGLREK